MTHTQNTIAMNNEQIKQIKIAIEQDCATIVRQSANMFADVNVVSKTDVDRMTKFTAEIAVYNVSHIDALNIHNELVNAWGEHSITWFEIPLRENSIEWTVEFGPMDYMLED